MYACAYVMSRGKGIDDRMLIAISDILSKGARVECVIISDDQFRDIDASVMRKRTPVTPPRRTRGNPNTVERTSENTIGDVVFSNNSVEVDGYDKYCTTLLRGTGYNRVQLRWFIDTTKEMAVEWHEQLKHIERIRRVYILDWKNIYIRKERRSKHNPAEVTSTSIHNIIESCELSEKKPYMIILPCRISLMADIASDAEIMGKNNVWVTSLDLDGWDDAVTSAGESKLRF